MILALFQSLILFLGIMLPVTLTPLGGSETISNWSQPVNSDGLSTVVRQALRGTSGKYYIYIRHLATGESYTQNQNEVIPAGSLYKSWLAVGVLDEIRQGRFSEQQILSESIPVLNKWAGLSEKDAELTKGVAKYSVSEALRQMIAVSHNYSAFLLTRKVGNPKIQKILKDQRLFDTHFARPPTVSASDMALFLEKVYRGRFFSDEKYSQKLRDLLAGNLLNDGLPKILPEGVRVEHKTGELNEYKHDCGIVYSKGGDYVICVMTKTNDPKLAEERIALISKAVYDYFNK